MQMVQDVFWPCFLLLVISCVPWQAEEVGEMLHKQQTPHEQRKGFICEKESDESTTTPWNTPGWARGAGNLGKTPLGFWDLIIRITLMVRHWGEKKWKLMRKVEIGVSSVFPTTFQFLPVSSRWTPILHTWKNSYPKVGLDDPEGLFQPQWSCEYNLRLKLHSEQDMSAHSHAPTTDIHLIPSQRWSCGDIY